MKVLKSINNNVVSCLDENGRELVAMGRGLGFAVRSGDELDISRAEKVFRMQSPDETRRLTDLFATLPPQQIGLCSLLCARLHRPEHIIVCEPDAVRREFVQRQYPDVILAVPENVEQVVRQYSRHGGADRVLEVAGTPDSFRLAWQCARPNAIVVVVALYDQPQVLPLPDMYGKNLTFITGGVDGCDCAEILRLIEAGELDTEPLLTHTADLADIEQAYQLFASHADKVMKVAVRCTGE